MKAALLLFVFSLLHLYPVPDQAWIIKNEKSYSLYYRQVDERTVVDCAPMVANGIREAEIFFGDAFDKGFAVYVHPSRTSLDSAWRQEWGMPDFTSECWMVASGIATKMDLVSPRVWSSQACEHKFENKEATQKLLTHELVHVYHGQRNKSPDFSDTEKMDWFVEGLATYASGQCDQQRILAVQRMILESGAPKSLDQFWTGKNKYGLSGTMVMYIDKKYGRQKINELIKYNKAGEVLSALKLDEQHLLAEWEKFVKSIN